jgi:hypothetical protein
VKKLILACILIGIISASLRGQSRAWTNGEGRQLLAELVDSIDGTATVKRDPDGQIFKLEISKLSAADQAFIANWRAEWARKRVSNLSSPAAYFPEQKSHVDVLMATALAYLAAHQKGAATESDWANYKEKSERALRSMPVMAAKYNEVVRENLSIPVRVGWGKDGDSLYLQVGEGAFATTVWFNQVEDYVAVRDALGKSLSWFAQTQDEALEATKDMGEWSGATLRFESFDGGTKAIVRLTVTQHRPITQKQVVKLNRLSTQALYLQMIALPDEYKAATSKEAAGNRLK